ncbi:DeoR/GlpR family DNA-binding transcription regulator [Paludisphaera mucosa]|uniref:DeoR/GlpR family DNA-binding transcription regulator n=1 Tax=Paludisphaera mucosa TaxID=3030827 RepID=A0ABT6F7Q1_9BACT|nr:DeoR/GlpR family DNA-binding transcription regulator [Paludisphaera mucosa]MDG3003594.1 DeoR/GlpR family DNA-binding transcription regulator [Paludisphaera mucosa]
MLTAERKQKLLEVLQTEGKILASELSRRFGVSEDTVRRDLRELDRAGFLQRVHGGALPRTPTSVEHKARQKESTDAKRRIGAAAARLLQPGQLVALDAGTTPLAVLDRLDPDLSLTIVTHSLPAATVLAEHPNIEGVIVGGRLFKSARAAVGVATVDAYRLLRPDLCILGAAGVHPEAGVTTFDGEEAEVKRAMAAHAARVVVLAASEKLGTVAPHLVTPAGRLTHLVTDSDASEEMIQPYRDLGVEVVSA